jgi:O-antigen ligase
VLGAGLAASLFYTPIPIAVLIGVPALFYFLSRPYELLLAMVFLIPFNFVVPMGPIPIAAELLKGFAWIPFLIDLSGRRTSFVTSAYNKWFLLWFVILLASVMRSADLLFTIKESVRLASNFGLCYLVINLVDSREKIFQVFRVLSISTFFVAGYGFYQFAIQDFGALFWLVNPRMDTGFAHGRHTFWEWRGRIISVLTSELELGHYFNMCLPASIVLWLSERGRTGAWKWQVIAVATLTGLLLTFTFGAWLSLAGATALFIFVIDRKRRWKLLGAAVLVLAFFSALLVAGPLRPFVFEKAFGNNIGSLAWDTLSRLDAWTFAVQTWWAHPLVGVGIGNYEILEYAHETIHSPWGEGGSTPHNTYLYLLGESGVVGLVGMLAIMLGTLTRSLKLRRNPEYGLIALALAFGLTCNLIGWCGDDSTFTGPHTSYLLWLIVGLSEAVRNLALGKSGVPSTVEAT